MSVLFNTPFATNPSQLFDAITNSIEAGIDPAFDANLEELERLFAEYRLTFDQR